MKIFKLLIISCLLMFIGAKVMAQPAWSVDVGNFNYNMTVSGVINLDYIESTDINDIVGAFIGGECRGVAKPVYMATVDRYIVYLMIYSNTASGTINFKVYDASADTETDIPVTMEFSVNGIIGETEAPYIWSNPTLSSEAEITAFTVPEQDGLTTIDGTNISLNMPYGTDLTGLIAEYTTSFGALVKVNNTVQTSGTSENDFTNPATYYVRSADETTEQNYIVTIEYSNDIPSDIFLSNDTIPETAPSGTLIGILSTEDSDLNDTHTYSLVEGIGDTDNESFRISNDSLYSNAFFDYETKIYYSIRIQTADYQGGTFEKEFEIEVSDEDENYFNANNAFSPNGDGINDYWEIQEKEVYSQCDFYILNATSHIVYRSKGYQNDWDGTYQGKDLPIGAYYYIVKCPECSDCKHSGTISLIR